MIAETIKRQITQALALFQEETGAPLPYGHGAAPWLTSPAPGTVISLAGPIPGCQHGSALYIGPQGIWTAQLHPLGRVVGAPMQDTRFDTSGAVVKSGPQKKCTDCQTTGFTAQGRCDLCNGTGELSA